ncbi:MAG: dihydrofolate reductase family protein, partial [Dehalococcoidia bacterium]|nr:dihydrofolate reductase family protein [Dehalococcoidia bacterium]
ASFLNEGLVDEVLQFVVPVLLGDGIPLYPALQKEVALKLVEAVSYRTGIVKLRYVPIRR